MAVRGYVWARYHADDGSLWAALVDADYAAEPSRGWSTDAVAGLYPIPRGWAPRHVIGYDPLGHARTAIVASVEAALWTGVATTFVISATDQTSVTCRVVARVEERSSRRP